MAKVEKKAETTTPTMGPVQFDDSVLKEGIPVHTAVFHRTIQSIGHTGGAGEPEQALYSTGAKPSRIAKMFYTPHGLYCVQKYGSILVPLANVSFVRVK